MAKNPIRHTGLLSSLQRLRDGAMGQPRELSSDSTEPRLMQLRSWQANRLATTYADLLDSPQYGPACQFFLTEIYAARDFRQRDRDAEHAYQVMKRFLPVGMLQTLSLVLQLNELTAELDNQLLSQLNNMLGLHEDITAPVYAEAYRLCDNYEARTRQIDLIIEVGQGVNRLVGWPFVGAVLRLARAPARRAGWSDLQSFLERGFNAFKQMDDVGHFLRAVESRERSILTRIYRGDATPFATDDSAGG